MYSLDNVYGDVDKIRNLKLVETNETFELMKDDEIREVAKRIVDNIEKSEYKTVVVSECGASPIIKICKNIAKKRNLNIEWFKFKTPRQNNVNLYEMISFYLTDNEQNEVICIEGVKKARKDFLNSKCKDININEYLPVESVDIKDVIKSINKEVEYGCNLDDILIGTKLYEIFSTNFIFFDEYILSGTTLKNFSFYAHLICKDVQFKIGAYLVFLDELEDFEQIEFTLYSKKNMLEAYKKGAYPYEDRIDIIGYFYYIDEKEYSKVNISDFICESKIEGEELNKFIDEIYNFIEKNDILEILKQRCKKDYLKEYFVEEDIVRFIFKVLEQENFKDYTKESKLIDDSFELYAPIWIPLPIEYHYQYWKSLVRIMDILDEFIKGNSKKYIDIRDVYICKLAKKITSKGLQKK